MANLLMVGKKKSSTQTTVDTIYICRYSDEATLVLAGADKINESTTKQQLPAARQALLERAL